MNTTAPRPLRALFLTLALVLAAFVGVEVALAGTAGANAAEGLAACGTEAAPCVLEAVAVEAITPCGSAEAPCVLDAVAVEAAPESSRFAAVAGARTTMRMGI